MTSLMPTATTARAVVPARSAARALVEVRRDDSRRGRLNAAAFGAIVFYGLSFALALVVPGTTLLVAQLAALVVAILAAGRLVGAADRRAWLRSLASVIAAVAITGGALLAIFAFLVWGPLAP